MLFNSFTFLFLFLPVTLTGWLLLKKIANLKLALGWLVIASLYFYASWDFRYLGVLLTSIGINFWIGGRILSAIGKAKEKAAGRWLKFGITFNLCVLGGFKYTYFLAYNLFSVFHARVPFDPITLPLAISFVTFQKIAYLVDCRRGEVKSHNAQDYLFFVSFFPQLIAGPIVHHKPLIAQTTQTKNPLFHQPEIFVSGFAFFAIGLFKKVVLADSLAHYASPVFELAKQALPSGEAAWQAMLAYTLQLYFDFSGYSDMAIGLALFFGFKLPVNFSSPYKATSVIDFWRKWHITLSNFLRDYLYIPLGGNSGGLLNQYRNLWITMLLAGIWHGAGWNFLLWGAIHGFLLVINHIWRSLKADGKWMLAILRFIPKIVYGAITFLTIAFTWILFRSSNLVATVNMYQSVLRPFSGNALPPAPWHSIGQLSENLFGLTQDLGWVWVSIGLLITFICPNSAELIRYDPTPNMRISQKMQVSMGILAGACFWLALKWMAVRPATEFLYFNF